MRASFWVSLEAVASLPVLQALPQSLRLTGRWSPPLQMLVGVDGALEPPPPLDRRLEGRR